MKQIFKNECKRKDKLFLAWNKVLEKNQGSIQNRKATGPLVFDYFFEGLVTVSKISKTSINLDLENGKKITQVQVNLEVCKHSALRDKVYLVIAQHANQWRALEVISISSSIESQTGCHFSYNPSLLGDKGPLN